MAQESLLLLLRLEATMTELGRGVDELKHNLFSGTAADLRSESLAESHHTLFGTSNAALQHQEVVLDNTVMREATHGGDVLLRQIKVSGAVVLDDGLVSLDNSLTNAVNLLVGLRTMMESMLTSAGNGVFYAGRMPRTNTSDLAETTMRLARKFAGTPTMGDTFVTVTLGNSANVQMLILSKDSRHRNLLLEVSLGPVDLLLDVGTTVHLDFHHVSLLGTEAQLVHLCKCKQ